MSDEELNALWKRMDLEKKVADLMPKKVSKGEKFVNDFLAPVGKTLLTNAGNKMIDLLDPKDEGYKTPDSLKMLRDQHESLKLMKQINDLKKASKKKK